MDTKPEQWKPCFDIQQMNQAFTTYTSTSGRFGEWYLKETGIGEHFRTPHRYVYRPRANVQVWDPSGEDHSSQDLAADKRAAIERRLREEDEEQDDAITK